MSPTARGFCGRHLADPDTRVADINDPPLVSVKARDDREDVLKAFEKYDRIALPVTDTDGNMLGIITVDDVLDVAEQEATEDIQKNRGDGGFGRPLFKCWLASHGSEARRLARGSVLG